MASWLERLCRSLSSARLRLVVDIHLADQQQDEKRGKRYDAQREEVVFPLVHLVLIGILEPLGGDEQRLAVV